MQKNKIKLPKKMDDMSDQSTPNSLSIISEERTDSPECRCSRKLDSPRPVDPVDVSKLMTARNKNQSFIFNEKFQAKKAKLRQKFRASVEDHIKNLSSADFFSNPECTYKYFYKILSKFLLKKQINQTDLAILSEYEQTLLGEFLTKRNYFKKKPEFYFKNPAQIRQSGNSKRVEENLKFVFRKLFKFLREVFNKTFRNTLIAHLVPKYRNSIRCDDYAFYGFLFEDSAIRLDTKIEKFFEPSIPKFDSASDECSKLIRKTISKLYLKCIKRSDYFMLFLKKFVNEVLVEEVKTNILLKLNHVISEWSLSEKENQKPVTVAKKVARLKFSWTLTDIEIATKHLFEYLGDISD